MFYTKAAVLKAAKEGVVIRRIGMPDLTPDRVVVKMVAAGVCGTQVARIANPDCALPVLMGHEGVGYVVATGKKVTHVKEGDLVAISWVPRGAPKGRPDFVAIGAHDGDAPVGGRIATWCRESVLWSSYVTKIAADSDPLTAAILGCAVITGAGAIQSNVGSAKCDGVAIVGVGGTGLAAIAMARHIGVERILAVDSNPTKKEIALRLGATAFFENNGQSSLKDSIISNGGQVDYALDCVGASGTLATCLELVKRGGPGRGNDGGTVVVLGLRSARAELDIDRLVRSQIRVVGTLGAGVPDTDFAQYLQLDLRPLVTDVYDFEDVNRACNDLGAGRVLGRAVLTFGAQ